MTNIELSEYIDALVGFAQARGLIQREDRVWAINSLLGALKSDEYIPSDPMTPLPALFPMTLADALDALTDHAVETGLCGDDITSRDLFDTGLMGLLTPRPSQVIAAFWEHYEKSPEEATDWYYALSRDTNYIRVDRIAKDRKWVSPTEYGELDITINLSKPEKDPRAIAAAKKAPQSGYPKCLLCLENEGYAGRMNHPPRQNHRVIPIKLAGDDWYLQYSPYVYYNEHCIVFNSRHIPMKIDRGTFRRQLDFVTKFPHYFLGSNADLPIVGGSILSHDHFQGGRYTFPMEKAPVEKAVTFPGFSEVEAGIVRWPMSVLRLRCGDTGTLVELADRILAAWRGWTDEEAFIFAETQGEPHNTVTPIARTRDGKPELDLVLRNNITTPEHPLGVYHPHQELHHIKKENIGLIEVMGLAVLPARLNVELSQLADALADGRDLRADEALEKHADWGEELKSRYSFTKDNAGEILRREVGAVFAKVLEHAGVYKRTPEGQQAMLRFVEAVK